MTDCKPKMIRLKPLADRELIKILETRRKLNPGKKVSKESVLNELIMIAALNEGKQRDPLQCFVIRFINLEQTKWNYHESKERNTSFTEVWILNITKKCPKKA